MLSPGRIGLNFSAIVVLGLLMPGNSGVIPYTWMWYPGLKRRSRRGTGGDISTYHDGVPGPPAIAGCEPGIRLASSVGVDAIISASAWTL